MLIEDVAVVTAETRLIPVPKIELLPRAWDYRGFIATCTDLERQNWTKSILLCGPEVKGYYTWVMDPATRSRYSIESDEFDWYGFEFSQSRTNRSRKTRVAAAPIDPIFLQPLYPPVSVDDFTPGWDRNRFPSCAR